MPSPAKPPSPSKFREEFPEFTTAKASDAEIEQAGRVASRLSAISSEALLWLTAHVLTLKSERTGDPDGGSGEVRGEGTGPFRTDYVTQAAEDGEAFYTTSVYGRFFLSLERRQPSRAITARVIG